ncbi:biopolymer transporter ExbD [Vibrio hannami]|uniref:ExbD/TolR family protein n=1 Tax=Vibrio hannami TaxID=2717094 RepID=UPI00240EF7F2|nr:biopolymer transporter ExbD [Vibrio hannami]MDG3087609.1 biopolymer transporter ExbD [Vibrio hannami]
MIRSRRTPHTSASSVIPDLTPLLDLVFIVMVFLLLTTNISVHTMDINIPQTEDGDVLSSPEKAVISVAILADKPRWAIDGDSFNNWEAFSSNLIQRVKANPKKTLVIAADKKADVESMLKLLAFLQSNNISATNIIMEDSTS